LPAEKRTERRLEPRNLQPAFEQIVVIAELPTGIAVTMNTYSHVVPALRKETAIQMDAILNPQEPVATKLLREVPN
jgi:hypothetical protein